VGACGARKPGHGFRATRRRARLCARGRRGAATSYATSGWSCRGETRAAVRSEVDDEIVRGTALGVAILDGTMSLDDRASQYHPRSGSRPRRTTRRGGSRRSPFAISRPIPPASPSGAATSLSSSSRHGLVLQRWRPELARGVHHPGLPPGRRRPHVRAHLHADRRAAYRPRVARERVPARYDPGDRSA